MVVALAIETDRLLTLEMNFKFIKQSMLDLDLKIILKSLLAHHRVLTKLITLKTVHKELVPYRYIYV